MKKSKRVLVCGAGGFIGGHLICRLKEEGFWVRGVDLKYNPHRKEENIVPADEFIIGDLRDPTVVDLVLDGSIDEVFQLGADMGGSGFVFTGDNDADIMHNSAMINLNILDTMRRKNIKKVFYSSSACAYSLYNQLDPNNPKCDEASAYPANPDSEYGWEKLFSERLYLSYHRNYGIDVRIARYHNIFGPFGSWDDGREKAPAAITRKIIKADLDGTGEIEIWGDGEQTRSFLYIDECIEGTMRLMESDFKGPVNIGSTEMISINKFAEMIMRIEGLEHNIKHIKGPTGVKGRNSDNKLIKQKLGWEPSQPLIEGLTTTYEWIKQQIQKEKHI